VSCKGTRSVAAEHHKWLRARVHACALAFPCPGLGHQRRDSRVKATSERAEASRGIGVGEEPQWMYWQEGIICQESALAFACAADDGVETLQDVWEVDSVVLHSGTASARARSRISGRSASDSTTSTRQPSKASRSATSPPGNHGDAGPSTSMRRSTSLASPRGPARVGAEDPNTADPVLPRKP